MKKRAAAARARAAGSRAHARRSFDTGAALAGEVLRRRAAARAAAAAKPRLGLLIAEGDSWFDYPFFDVLGCLEARGFEIESVAHKGDTLEDMAHEAAQVDKLTRAFEKVSARGGKPRAILLSGGGNDIAGDEFPLLLNHSGSGLPRLNATRGAGDHRRAAARGDGEPDRRRHPALARRTSASACGSSCTATTTRSPTAAATSAGAGSCPARGSSRGSAARATSRPTRSAGRRPSARTPRWCAS